MFAHGNHGVSRSPGLQGFFIHFHQPFYLQCFPFNWEPFISPPLCPVPDHPGTSSIPPRCRCSPGADYSIPPITRPSVSSISTSATLTSYSRLLALHLFPVLVEQYKSIEIHNTGQNVQHFPCQSVEVVRTKTSNNAMQWEHFSDRGFPRSVASEVRVWYK